MMLQDSSPAAARGTGRAFPSLRTGARFALRDNEGD